MQHGLENTDHADQGYICPEGSTVGHERGSDPCEIRKVHTNQRKTNSESSKAPCTLLFTLYYIPGSFLLLPGSGGVFIAGDPEMYPIYHHQLVTFRRRLMMSLCFFHGKYT